MQDSYMRWPQVKAAVGLSRTTAWRMEKIGSFPHRRQVGPKAVAWLKTEISAWIATREIVSNRP